MNKQSVFSFSEELQNQVEDALISRMVDAALSDSDIVEGFVRYGIPPIEGMPSMELMDEYMNWHGTFSLEENPNDQLLRRMFEEVHSHEFEKEVLNEQEKIQFKENCANTTLKEEIS